MAIKKTTKIAFEKPVHIDDVITALRKMKAEHPDQKDLEVGVLFKDDGGMEIKAIEGMEVNDAGTVVIKI